MGLYRVQGLWGGIGILEKKMETTILWYVEGLLEARLVCV